MLIGETLAGGSLLASGAGLLIGGHRFARRKAEDLALRENGIPLPASTVDPPKGLDAVFLPVTETLPDGSKLQLLLVLNTKYPDSMKMKVFCQGRMTAIQGGYKFLKTKLDAGLNVTLFNYRGVGAPGRATFRSTCEDAVAAYKFGLRAVSYKLAGGWGVPPASQEITPAAIGLTGLLGYSYGGYPATYAAYEVFGQFGLPGTLALMDTGCDMFESICRVVPAARLFVPSLLLSPRLDNLALIAKMPATRLIVGHALHDAVRYINIDEATGKSRVSNGFPVEDGWRLFQAALGERAMFVFENSGHKDMLLKDPEVFTAFIKAIAEGLG